MNYQPLKIISGGQTGADRGALIAAKTLRIPTGGWLPKGCRTEAGPASHLLCEYDMREHTDWAYPARTVANVVDADGTIWIGKTGSPGYKCTYSAACRAHKPFEVITTPEQLTQWCIANHIHVLNVAGNRESSNPGIQAEVALLITQAFSIHEVDSIRA